MRSPLPPGPSGFTVVEMLVVMAIIALLAALLLAALGRMQENAYNTKCTANLRQIGIAINAFCNDNDDTLPGPLAVEQYPRLGTAGADDDQALAKKLARYLGLNTDPKVLRTFDPANVFLCPSYLRNVPAADGAVYVLNSKKLGDASPFGDPGWKKDPVKKVALSNWVDTTPTAGDTPVNLAITWVMKDADQMDFLFGATSPKPPGFLHLAANPVHGDHRNALFFDWHVGKLEIDPQKKDQLK